MSKKIKTEWTVPRGAWVTNAHAARILNYIIKAPVNWDYWLLEDRRGRNPGRPHIPFLRLPNRRTMYDTADLEDFIEAVKRGEIVFNRRLRDAA